MKQVFQTTQFARDIRRMRKRGKDLSKLREVVGQLAEGVSLDPKHRDHPLLGEWRPSRDCHVEPNWILIYTPTAEALRLDRTGTHADLFR